MRNRFLVLLTLCACLFCVLGPAARPAHGQAATTGGIAGTVTDQTGAVVPGADITVTEVATGIKHTTKSDSVGRYEILALPSNEAHMNVSVSKQGFQTFVSQDVVIDPSTHVTVNAALQVGTGTTEVTVTATAVQVNTQSGESAGVIAGDEVSTLQLNGRDWRDLSKLIPGMNDLNIGHTSLGGGLNGGNNVSVNGLDTSENMYTTDGAYNVNTGSMGNENVLQPVDSISEFKVIKDNYSARYGWAGGAQFMVATKSGTKDFHGNGYDYLRNDKVDSRNFFNTSTPVLKQNIFGGSIGGPVFIPGHYNTDKSKTFFFSNEEFRIRHDAVAATGSLPTQAMRNGDFSQDPYLISQGISGLTTDSTSQAILASEFPGVNCMPSKTSINSSCFDPNSVALMNHLWPLPNYGGPTSFVNYLDAGVETVDQQDYTERIDHRFNDKYTLMARMSYETETDSLPYLSWGPNPAPNETNAFKETGFNNMMQFTANINPTTINQLTFTQTDDKPVLTITGAYRKDLSSPLTINLPYGLSADNTARLPNINMGQGWSGQGDATLPEYASDQENVVADDFTKIKGGHTLQAGVMLVWGIKRQSNFAQTEGEYAYSGVHTGDAEADYLLGLDASFFQNNTRLRSYSRYHQDEAYFQDDWKINRKFTLNYGVREFYFSPDTTEGNGISDFSPALYNPATAPVVNLNGTLLTNAALQPLTSTGTIANTIDGIAVLSGFQPTSRFPLAIPTAGIPNGWYTTKPHFGPRVGFAWDPWGNGKQALRGGYGVGYGRIPFGNYACQLGNPPFESSVTLLNGAMTTPAIGAPGAPTAQGICSLGPPNVNYVPTQQQSYSVTAEREIVPGGVLTLAYVGSHTNDYRAGYDTNFPLPVATPTQNIAGSSCLSAGETLNPSGGFAFDPCINAGTTSSAYTRPIQGYNNISTSSGYAGAWPAMGNYHALQAGYRYVSHKGLTLTFAYTWQHALTNNWSQISGIQNTRNIKAEYGQPGFGQHQLFNASYIYQLPFLKGRTDFTAKALGNWTFSGITSFISGAPNTIGMSTAAPGLTTRPNCIGSMGGPKTRVDWFNTSAFANVPNGYFGNCANGTVYGPGLEVWDWALFKTFPVKERVKIQLRFEAFNIWNHTNFTGLSTGYGSGSFASLNSALDPRQLEGALRIQF